MTVSGLKLPRLSINRVIRVICLMSLTCRVAARLLIALSGINGAAVQTITCGQTLTAGFSLAPSGLKTFCVALTGLMFVALLQMVVILLQQVHSPFEVMHYGK